MRRIILTAILAVVLSTSACSIKLQNPVLPDTLIVKPAYEEAR